MYRPKKKRSKRSIGKNNRLRGKKGELEVRNLARTHWRAGRCIRSAQANGKLSADISYALPGTHIECKRKARFSFYKDYEQAMNDAPEGDMPILCVRADHKQYWLVIMKFEDTTKFAQQLFQQLQEGSDEE